MSGAIAIVVLWIAGGGSFLLVRRAPDPPPPDPAAPGPWEAFVRLPPAERVLVGFNAVGFAALAVIGLYCSIMAGPERLPRPF